MNSTSPLTTTLFILAIALAIASGVTWIGGDIVERPQAGDGSELKLLSKSTSPALSMEMFFTSFSLVILAFLLVLLVRLHRELPNRLTLTLILFASALVVSVTLANPITWSLLGVPPEELSSLSYLPDAFIAIGVSILLYQTAM